VRWCKILHLTVASSSGKTYPCQNGECAACLKYSVLIFVEKIYKMQHLDGSGTPVLYIWDAQFLKVKRQANVMFGLIRILIPLTF
jgi:hypothetical protein